MRLRLILSILSGKSILIRKIRHKQSESKLGLEDYEVNLLRLIEKVTNGSRIEIDETGTELFFQPGLLNGGKLTHDCNSKRNISYFLEVLLCLAPFTKEPFNIILNGTTNGSMLLSDSTTGHNSELYDASVDCVIASSLPILEKFLGVADGLELKILRRAVLPKSGGKVLFKCPNKAKLRPVQLTEPGKIKKIRGVAFSCKVPPSLANRVGESCKKVLS